MKNISKFLMGLVIATGLLLPACSDEYLDLDPQTSLSADMAIGNIKDAQVALIGIYDGIQSTEFYYGRNYVVTADIASDDVMVSPSNSGRFLAQFNYNVIASNGDNASFWNRAWLAINRANNVINKIDNIEDGTQAARDQILGEALTLRALIHFDLARMYGKPYGWDANALSVPYMEEAAIGEPARETNQVVYDKIMADINRAIPLLTEDREPVYVSEYVAKALLARVYLYMDNFEQAAITAVDVIDNGGYTLTPNEEYVAGWAEPFTGESIFSVSKIATDYGATNALGYIYLESGYGDLFPTEEIVSLLENAGNTEPGDDVRYDAFLKYEEGDDALFINKFPGRGGQAGLDNTPILRLSEMYLIAAEAYARQASPDLEKARFYLNAIRERGNPDATAITTDNAQALAELIYLEKRIEFAFEGHRFFDIRRRKEDLIRGDDCISNACAVMYGDDRFVYPIPQREMDANPNMVQNPGYGSN
ncbi:MAG: RagB/SusD family nutrient uptake outer membrane protein [Bacteroidales bacterium]